MGIGAPELLVLLPGLLFVVLVAVIFLAGRRTRRRDDRPPVDISVASAEQLLAERLARGEIDPVEYRERLAALRDV